MRPQTKVLRLCAVLVVVFGVSFFVFYRKARQKQNSATPLILTSRVINQQLPRTNLVNISGQSVDDEKLRHGKVILAFMMPDCVPCDQENEFLKTIVDSRKDIPFFYVIPFGNKKLVLKSAQTKYALEPVYDKGSNLARTLEINEVPIKIFLEDGIIKRTWLHATITQEKQNEFRNWLRDL